MLTTLSSHNTRVFNQKLPHFMETWQKTTTLRFCPENYHFFINPWQVDRLLPASITITPPINHCPSCIYGIVGERCRKQKISYGFTKIHLWVHLATSDWMHIHTFVDRERKRSKNGDEVVVHDVIQITGDPSAERTTPPRSTHVRSA